ncbi:MAG: hypothetical protein DDT19_02432 [Syntrophomonadaceae bacterium]|nr:hypothetical protein [Bacillota bacterium]
MMKNYLEVNLVRFIQLLRYAGIRIGSGEVLDALNALSLLDLSDREAVRAGLKATLVKRSGEQQLFDKAFALFFAPPEAKEEYYARYRQEQTHREQLLAKATEELTFQGMPLKLLDSEKTVFSGMPERDKEKLLEYIKKGGYPLSSSLIGVLHEVGALFFEGCLSKQSLLAQLPRLTLLVTMIGASEEELSGYPPKKREKYRTTFPADSGKCGQGFLSVLAQKPPQST